MSFLEDAFGGSDQGGSDEIALPIPLVGDVVRLNSGGPLMAVVEHKGDSRCECHGYDSVKGIFSTCVHPAVLTKICVNHEQITCWQCAVEHSERDTLVAAADGNFYCSDCYPVESV